MRYEVDPYNRLILDRPSSKYSNLPRFRKAIDGRFLLDGSNNLTYNVKAPVSSGDNIPHQIRLKGDWSLDDGHRLQFTLNKFGRQTLGDQLTLAGEIIDAGENSILFAVTTTSKRDTRTTYVLELGGVWRADKRNRLSFHVRRESGRYDILTFNGAWEVDNNKRIVYRYESSDLVTKSRRVHTLEFDGYWDIQDKYRISYLFGAGTDSSFEFKTSAGIFSKNYIKYEMCVGIAGSARPVKRTVSLFGRWFLKKDTGVVFEFKYADKKTREIVFGADFKITGGNTVSLRLKSSEDDKDIGATLGLSRKIFKGDGEAFLCALVSGRQMAIYAGAAWRW